MNANEKYASTTRPGSSTHFYDRELSNVSISVKNSKSPHISKLCFGIIIAIIVTIVLVVVISVAVYFALQGEGTGGGGEREGNGRTTLVTTPPVPYSDSSEQTTLARFLSTPRTTMTPSPSEWLAWSDWTQCTATCGSGIHKRYRTCYKSSPSDSNCVGDYVQKQMCTNAACPVYGTWVTWSSWGSCDVTCGGGQQTRTRTCSKASSSDIDCVGTGSQQQQCATWDCPDCGQTCSVGTLNSNCDTCVCTSTVIIGRVEAAGSGHPIGNAALYATVAPTRMLAESNSTGNFVLSSTCINTELLATREGFQDTVVEVTGTQITVSMTAIVRPYMTKSPQSKNRLLGESVTFCCEATGAPNISYYEWLKDSLILDNALYENGTHLQLTDLAIGDSGQYKCRANSPVGAVMSTIATLKVKGSSDEFCADSLQQKIITLPDDCVQSTTNTATYEVGECVAKSCRAGTTVDNGACRDELNSCCSMSQAELKTVQCSGYELHIVVVKACGCAQCTVSSIALTGSALGMGNNLPLKYGQVWVNGKLEAYTNSQGKFSLAVSKDLSQVAITLKDAYYKQFLETVKVVHISEEMSGSINVEISMVQAAAPIKIQSDVENMLSVASDTIADALQVSIPSNSFYYPNGTAFIGTLSASLTFLDPTNDTLSTSIPGNFQFVNDEGQRGNLASLGVFNLLFQDEAGNDLVVTEVVDLYIPLSVGNGSQSTKDFKLWKLNPETGIWDIITAGPGTRKRKRQSTATWIGELDTIDSWEWWNIDMIYDTYKTCYFKIRAYKDIALTYQVINPSRPLQVEIHIKANDMLVTERDYTSSPNDDCIYVPCEDDTGYITVFTWGFYGYEPLYVATPKVSPGTTYDIIGEQRVLKTQLASSSNGPFYNDRDICIVSDEDQNHFRYRYEPSEEVYIVVMFFNPSYVTENLEWSAQRAWYPERGQEGYSVCHAKVRIEFEDDFELDEERTIKIRVISLGGTYEQIAGEILGIFEHTVANVDTDTTACIEYKCSGKIETSYDDTRVDIVPVIPTTQMECSVVQMAEQTIQYLPDRNHQTTGGSHFTFYAPAVYGPDYGLYRATSDLLSIENAKSRSYQACRSAGAHDNTSEEPTKGLAVTFSCKSLIPAWWV